MEPNSQAGMQNLLILGTTWLRAAPRVFVAGTKYLWRARAVGLHQNEGTRTGLISGDRSRHQHWLGAGSDGKLRWCTRGMGRSPRASLSLHLRTPLPFLSPFPWPFITSPCHSSSGHLAPPIRISSFDLHILPHLAGEIRHLSSWSLLLPLREHSVLTTYGNPHSMGLFPGSDNLFFERYMHSQLGTGSKIRIS